MNDFQGKGWPEIAIFVTSIVCKLHLDVVTYHSLLYFWVIVLVLQFSSLSAMKNIGDRIRVLRQIKGFSQENMAIELGISQQGYSNLERSATRMKLCHLLRISEVLEVQASFLLSEEPLLVEKQESTPAPHAGILKEEVELLREKVKLVSLLPPPATE